MANLNNLIIYVSGRNNYDMLEFEVLKNINFERYEFICVDDNSCEDEILKGERICKENDIVFLKNKNRGVQWATQTLIDFINENRPECKYIVCFQHDIIPLSKQFFSKFSEMIETRKLDNFGTIGFNVLDNGKYTHKAYGNWKHGVETFGMLGLCHLSITSSRDKRWLCPSQNFNLLSNPSLWNKPFAIEIPAWTCVAINVSNWNKFIQPTDGYQFHLWLPSIAMQFLKHNIYNITIPSLYLFNHQELKLKYNIPDNSAKASKNGDTFHFGEYQIGHDTWKKQFGWEYDNTTETLKDAVVQYPNSLIERFYHHNITKGPLKVFDI